MPVNNFSVGRDVSLDIVGPSGPVRFTLITGFQSKPEFVEQKIKGLDGITRPLRFPDGWSGSFDIERRDSSIDDYFAQLEANYYAGQNETPVTITETIQERNGSISQFRYVDVLLKLDDAGKWQGDKSVVMQISFISARRVKVA